MSAGRPFASSPPNGHAHPATPLSRCSRGARHADWHLDPLRETPCHRAAAAAFQYNQIPRAYGLRRIGEIERHPFDGEITELLDADRLLHRVCRREDPAATVCGEGVGEVDDPVGRFAAAHVSEDIAQDLAAQRIETFRHERAAGVDPRLDFGHGDFEVSGGVAQRDRGPVLARDDPGLKFSFGGLDVPGAEGRIDFAVRIDDVGEQLGRAMRADAGEVRSDLSAFLAKFVANRAGGGEDDFAGGHAPRLRDHRRQLRDHFVLCFFAGVQVVAHGCRALGHFLRRVSAEAVRVRRPEGSGINGLSLHPFEQCQRPIGALEKHIERRPLEFERELRVGLDKDRAHGLVIGFAERGDESLLEGCRVFGRKLVSDLIEVPGVGAANSKQTADGGHAGPVVRCRISQGL